jgi:hypothetical protein
MLKPVIVDSYKKNYIKFEEQKSAACCGNQNTQGGSLLG